MRCIICGRDLSGQPAMRDNVTGVAYCSEHASFMDVVNSGELSNCSKCGMRYSRTRSLFVKQACPACGALLLQATVVLPYGKGENERVRQHIDPLREEVATRLQAANLTIGTWEKGETYRAGSYEPTISLRVDPARDASLNRDELVAAIKNSLEGLQLPSGSHIYCDGQVSLHKRAALP